MDNLEKKEVEEKQLTDNLLGVAKDFRSKFDADPNETWAKKDTDKRPVKKE